MTAPLADTPFELVFEAQVPFSWTRRWALTHRADAKPPRPSFRIEGLARSETELSAAMAFARAHEARLELSWPCAA